MKVYYPARHGEHTIEGYYLEGPQRVENILTSISGWKTYSPVKVGDTDSLPILKELHGEDYVAAVREMADGKRAPADASTYMVPASFDAALNAASTAVKAARESIKRKTTVFAAVRPPGHHASYQEPNGFCIFNNAAAAASAILKDAGGRVFILDLDAHAGDGTMDLFYKRSDVFFMSLHEDPHHAYPHRGFAGELGHGGGYGYTVNVELPAGITSKPYNLILEKLAIPLIMWYSPSALVVSMGFDTFYMDRTSNISIPLQGYYYMGKTLSDLKIPITVVLEGGYTPALGECTLAFFGGLLGSATPELFPALDISYRIVSKSVGINTAREIVASRRSVINDIHGDIVWD